MGIGKVFRFPALAGLLVSLLAGPACVLWVGAHRLPTGIVGSLGDTSAPVFALDDDGRGHIRAAQPAAPESYWVRENVDAPKQFRGMRDRSLALDSTGNPRIAYGGDFLYYAWHEGVAWHLETVDASPSVGFHTSLAVDQEDKPHISYSGGGAGLKYAQHDGAHWHIETVDSEGRVGYHTSLALDAAGQPHISYCYRPFEMADRSRLKYAHHDGSAWHFETVDKEGAVGGHISLALGAEGQPHIGYYDWGNRNLKYAHHDGDTWLVEAIDIAKTRDSDTSMALDAQDRPYFAYSNSSYGALLIASYNGTIWVTETVDCGESSSYDPSLVVDGNDQPHVSYLQYPRGPGPSPGRLVYAYRAGTGWVTETVVSDEIGGPSLVLDQAGRPHIGYSVYSDVKYAYFDGISWHIEVVDGGEGEKGDPSIALDSHGRPHFSYCLISGYSCVSLEYAYHDGSTWRIETVDSGEGVGSYSSLALDTADLPHVTFADGIDGDLRYARHDGSGWRVETIDTADWVGSYSSLALDASGQPHVSYNSGLTSDLRYAYAVCVPPELVVLRGPLATLVGQVKTYRAAVRPVTTSLPLAISWDNGTFGPEAIYSWTLTGTYTLMVTATNACGETQGTLRVKVLEEWPYHFYLPVVLRGS